jgi:hypothetical protein
VTPTTREPDDVGNVGATNAAARSDHEHPIVAATPVAVSTALSEGVASSFPRSDHAHTIGTGAINNSNMFASGVVDDENLFSAALSPFIFSATNPGAIGANRIWYNTTKDALLKRNAGNTAWEVLLDLSTGTDYTPTLSNMSLGSGGINDGRYRRVGRSIVADGFVKIGSGGNVTGRIGVSLPVAAANLSADYASDFFFHGAGRATDDSAGTAYGGVGIIGVSDAGTFDVNTLDFIATAGGAAWSGTVPFNWDVNDRFSWFCEYVAASKEDANYV